MKTKVLSILVIGGLALALTTGCGEKGTTGSKIKLDTVEISANDPLFYLPVVAAEASSFDPTPDWAPAPNPMAPVDGDLLTRWASNYESQEDWIYFDLGQESVVSEISIRWERAYAAKYKIQISKDAKTWLDVYEENNSKGGIMKADLPPVKCRYIKIQCVEKAEEQWGISIWEVELYGPKSLNSQALISKDEYLKKGNEEEKRKEAEALINSLSSAIVPLSQKPFRQGVVYTSWMDDELASAASDIMLTNIKKMGFDSISIMVPAYQDELQSDTVFVNDSPGGDTPSMKSLKHAIEISHKLGLRVMLKVHVDPRTDEARINIIPGEKWFDSYKELVMKYAKFSQKNKVEEFSVGTELEGTTFEAWDHRWRDIITSIRSVYDGVLTYSANWTEYKDVPFWDEMEYIGIDAYFPLTNKNDPTLEELMEAWDKHADEIEAWLNEKGLTDKGVRFTEIGYTSTNGTNRQPWVAISSIEDQQEQADCLEAFLTVFSKRAWFRGYDLWQYFPQKRWSPLGFTINEKKAEPVMKKWIALLNENAPFKKKEEVVAE
ncbi:MAG: discoidin domain-containing protein [Candidatus Omnitrophica bacterium]|nr:discoidin domain-containing protein [Candidatus Omnitrophota bacterium]